MQKCLKDMLHEKAQERRKPKVGHLRTLKHRDASLKDTYNDEAIWYEDWSWQTWEADSMPCNKENSVSSNNRAVPTHPPRARKPPVSRCKASPVVGSKFHAVSGVLGWRVCMVDKAELRKRPPMKEDAYGVSGDADCSSSADSACCIVCFGENASLHSADCSHKLCLECWGRYAEAEIDAGHGEMKCPAPGCHHMAPEGVLECVLQKDSWRRLRSLRETATVTSDPSLCYCPAAGCGRIVRTSTAEAAIAHCICGTSWCVHCKGPPHWPASCSEQRWLDANRGFLVSVRSEGNKLCPADRKSVV